MMIYRKRWPPHTKETRQQQRVVLVVVVSSRRRRRRRKRKRKRKKRRREGGNKRSSIPYAFVQRHIPQNQLEKEMKISFLFCLVHLSTLPLPELQAHFDLLVTFSLLSPALDILYMFSDNDFSTILVYLSSLSLPICSPSHSRHLRRTLSC